MKKLLFLLTITFLFACTKDQAVTPETLMVDYAYIRADYWQQNGGVIDTTQFISNWPYAPKKIDTGTAASWNRGEWLLSKYYIYVPISQYKKLYNL